MQNLISVIMPAYNQAQYISEAIESVLFQSHKLLELIIIDDGSEDQTAEICRQYAAQDLRVIYHRQSRQGVSAARNRALDSAKGQYIALLDSDDRMKPGRLAKELQCLLQNEDIGVVYTAVQLIDEQGAPLAVLAGESLPKENFLPYMLFRNIVPGGPNALIKRSAIGRLRFNQYRQHAEDYEFYLHLAEQTHFYYLNEPLTEYRRHAGNVSKRMAAHRTAELDIVTKFTADEIAQILASAHLSSSQKELLTGKIFYNREEWQVALSFLEPLSDPLAKWYKGNCYYKMGQFQQAEQQYRQAIQEPLPEAWNNLGLVQQQLGKSEKAIEAFKQAISLNSGYLDPQKNLIEPIYFTFKELRRTLMPDS